MSYFSYSYFIGFFDNNIERICRKCPRQSVDSPIYDFLELFKNI